MNVIGNTAEIAAAKRQLRSAKAAFKKADNFAASLPTEGFNCHVAMTPALERRGRAQRSVWKAEEALKKAMAA
jgi:hypothetical protein